MLHLPPCVCRPAAGAGVPSSAKSSAARSCARRINYGATTLTITTPRPRLRHSAAAMACPAPRALRYPCVVACVPLCSVPRASDSLTAACSRRVRAGRGQPTHVSTRGAPSPPVAPSSPPRPVPCCARHPSDPAHPPTALDAARPARAAAPCPRDPPLAWFAAPRDPSPLDASAVA